jgi:hypothetical protein
MPTILRWGPYRTFFYSNERGEPPHIHVRAGDPAHEIRAIIRHLRSQRDVLEGKWYEHFGN